MSSRIARLVATGEFSVLGEAGGVGAEPLAAVIELACDRAQHALHALGVVAGDDRADVRQVLETAQRARSEVEPVDLDAGGRVVAGRDGHGAQHGRFTRTAQSVHEHSRGEFFRLSRTSYIGSAKIVNSTAMITEMTVAVIATPDISRFVSSCFSIFAIMAFEPVEKH